MRRCTKSRRTVLARLACVKHAASVRSEPGSNSPVEKLDPSSKLQACFWFLKKTQKYFDFTPKSSVEGPERLYLLSSFQGATLQPPERRKSDTSRRPQSERLLKKGSGSDLLSHTKVCSTIGARGLNFRVRYGIGCGPSAIATGKVTIDPTGLPTGSEVKYPVLGFAEQNPMNRVLVSMPEEKSEKEKYQAARPISTG